MERLGPWDAPRRVAVAVSGGPDSLALALLCRGWGNPTAFIVDHGVRAASAAEAEWVRATLARLGMSATVLRLAGLAAGPGLAARARTARYAALSRACRHVGLVDLLLGHHAGDQAETVLMRRRRGSGPNGLAGMAALVETADVRLLRPLLAFDPVQLRRVVADAGLTPVEDPTNTDLRTTRARLRQEIGIDRGDLLAIAAIAGDVRARADAAMARELAARVQLHSAGFAVVSPGPIASRTLAAILRSLSGRRWPVTGIDGLAARPHPATVAGVQVQPAGRLGLGWLLTREVAALAAPVEAQPAAVWDGRYRVAVPAPECTVGALGDAASGLRHLSTLPYRVLQALPAFRRKSVLSYVPDLNYLVSEEAVRTGALRHAGLPASGAPFLPS